jgi:hypothetical protein
MINSLIYMYLVGQIVGPPSNRLSTSEYQHKAQVSTPQLSATSDDPGRRAEFRRRYQAVVEAMNAFSERFNASGGLIWPRKEAEKLQKAFRALADVEPSFVWKSSE